MVPNTRMMSMVQRNVGSNKAMRSAGGMSMARSKKGHMRFETIPHKKERMIGEITPTTEMNQSTRDEMEDERSIAASARKTPRPWEREARGHGERSRRTSTRPKHPKAMHPQKKNNELIPNATKEDPYRVQRRSIPVLPTPGSPLPTFDDLPLLPELCERAKALGWHHPTRIQYHVIGPTLEGKNVRHRTLNGTIEQTSPTTREYRTCRHGVIVSAPQHASDPFL